MRRGLVRARGAIDRRGTRRAVGRDQQMRLGQLRHAADDTDQIEDNARRSAPIIKSRLRSPISKSTTTTFCPSRAKAAPSAANATFAGCHDQDLCHANSLRQFIAEIFSVSPSSQAWIGWP
jgi:hypothetical protein